MQTAQNFTVLKYKNNLLQKILFWQCVFTLVLLVAFGIKFYEKYQEGLQFTHKKYHKWAIINRTSDKTYRIVNLNEFNKDPTSPKWLNSCAYRSYDTSYQGWVVSEITSDQTNLMLATTLKGENHLIDSNGIIVKSGFKRLNYLTKYHPVTNGLLFFDDPDNTDKNTLYYWNGDSLIQRERSKTILIRKNYSFKIGNQMAGQDSNNDIIFLGAAENN